MKKVASLRYGTVFKKAFSEKKIFTAFVRDVLGLEIEIEKVETEKSFQPAIGHVAVEFDLYAEDKKNRLMIDIQHKRDSDHYDRFFHYLCVALLEQVKTNYNYRPGPFLAPSGAKKGLLAVFSIVVLTSGDKHARDVSIIDCDPHDLSGKALGEIPHKVIYLCPKYVNEETPKALQEWMLAIQDSLDEEVDESLYTKAEIQRVFEIIEKDLISPEERAQMFEEYNQQEAIGGAYVEGHKKGRQEGRKEGEEEGHKKGEQKKALEVASKLLAGGLPPEQVATFTGLSLSEVETL